MPLLGIVANQRHIFFGCFDGSGSLSGDFNLAIGGRDRADSRFAAFQADVEFLVAF